MFLLYSYNGFFTVAMGFLITVYYDHVTVVLDRFKIDLKSTRRLPLRLYFTVIFDFL